MIPLRTALALSTGVATALLLFSPEVASHAPARQSASSSTQIDPARAQRQARYDKAREIQRAAIALLKRAGAVRPDSADSKRLLVDAASRIEALVSELSAPPALLPDDLQKELRQAARTLRDRARDGSSALPSSTDSVLALLERVAARLESDSLGDLAFQGSYSQTQTAEPVYGGHASAMGPPPDLPAAGGAS